MGVIWGPQNAMLGIILAIFLIKMQIYHFFSQNWPKIQKYAKIHVFIDVFNEITSFFNIWGAIWGSPKCYFGHYFGNFLLKMQIYHCFSQTWPNIQKYAKIHAFKVVFNEIRSFFNIWGVIWGSTKRYIRHYFGIFFW